MNEEQVRQELKNVAYRFADACVEKAMLRLKQHPERSPTPWKLDADFLARRLIEEHAEWQNTLDKFPECFEEESELEDIGNLASWKWYRAGLDLRKFNIEEVPSPR